MPIEFACTNCAKTVRVPDGSEGKKCKCPECQEILLVPDATPLDLDIEIKLEIPCPRCEHVLVCDPSLEGTRGLCPSCKHIFTIAAVKEEESEDESNILHLTFPFQCPHCKQLFEGKPGMEGKKGKCINCKQVFEIKKHEEPTKTKSTKSNSKRTEPQGQTTGTSSTLPPLQPLFPPTRNANETAPVLAKPISIDGNPAKAIPVAVPVSPINVSPVTVRPISVQPVAVTPVVVQPVTASPVKVTPVTVTPVTVTPVAVTPVAAAPANDWFNSGTTASYNTTSQVSNQAAPFNPYASTAGSNMHLGAPSGSAESIRRSHINHESSIKTFGVLIGLNSAIGFLGFFMTFGLAFVGNPPDEVPYFAIMMITSMIFLMTSVFMAFVCHGLYTLSSFGRIGGAIVGALMLLNVPCGTMMGILLLFLLFSEKGNMVFSSDYKQIIRQTPHVKASSKLLIWLLIILFVLVLIMMSIAALILITGKR